MLLQIRNITLVPRGVHVGFVVVLLLPEKVKPFDPLEISQNRFFGSLYGWYRAQKSSVEVAPSTSTYFRSATLSVQPAIPQRPCVFPKNCGNPRDPYGLFPRELYFDDCKDSKIENCQCDVFYGLYGWYRAQKSWVEVAPSTSTHFRSVTLSKIGAFLFLVDHTTLPKQALQLQNQP